MLIRHFLGTLTFCGPCPVRPVCAEHLRVVRVLEEVDGVGILHRNPLLVKGLFAVLLGLDLPQEGFAGVKVEGVSGLVVGIEGTETGLIKRTFTRV